MTTQSKAGPKQTPPSTYGASWLDRLADRVESCPGPAWCYYLAAWGVLFALGALLARHDFGGTSRFRENVWYYAPLMGLPIYVLGLMHYLRSSARVALEGFRPVYREDDSVSGQVWTPAEAMFQLTTTPALPSLVGSVVGMGLVGVLIALGTSPFQRLGIARSPLSSAFNILVELASWATFGAAAYSIARTLQLVSRFYTRHARVSLFQLQPLYAFSALTARYALGVLVGPFIFFALMPGLLQAWSSAVLAVATVAGAFILFAGPLASAHQLLAAEKSALLAENARRLREVLERLHAAVDDGESGNASSLQSLLIGLEHERAILVEIATWPWRRGLFRAFLSALLLPVVIWLTQFVLARLLQP